MANSYRNLTMTVNFSLFRFRAAEKRLFSRVAWWAAMLLGLLLPYVGRADSGLYKDFVVLQSGTSGNNDYYYTNLATSNYQFSGADLGTFSLSTGGRLLLQGGEINTYQNNGVDMQAAQLAYRIYPAGGSAGAFQFLNLPYQQSGLDGNPGNKQWALTTANVDLLAQVQQAGQYVLEVYLLAQGTYQTSSFTNYDSQNGANYRATFSVTRPSQPVQTLTPETGSGVARLRKISYSDPDLSGNASGSFTYSGLNFPVCAGAGVALTRASRVTLTAKFSANTLLSPGAGAGSVELHNMGDATFAGAVKVQLSDNAGSLPGVPVISLAINKAQPEHTFVVDLTQYFNAAVLVGSPTALTASIVKGSYQTPNPNFRLTIQLEEAYEFAPQAVTVPAANIVHTTGTLEQLLLWSTPCPEAFSF
jgi:hypothetical protein